jgi:hypothetical protein
MQHESADPDLESVGLRENPGYFGNYDGVASLLRMLIAPKLKF